MLLVALAHAQQTGALVEGTDGRVFVDVRWRDRVEDHRLYVTLENSSVDAATGSGDARPTGCHEAMRAAAFAEQARSWKAWHVDISKPGGDCSIRISVRGSGDAAAANAALMRAADVGKASWLAEHGLIEVNGRIRPDYASVVPRSVAALVPIAEALREPGDDAERYAARALSYVQTIPYEVEKGYRSPISVVLANRGDCDSKAGLFAALVHAAFPEVPIGLVLIPGHAFAVLGLAPHMGAERWEAEGETWIYAEPVGPALRPLGTLGDLSVAAAPESRKLVRIP